MVSVLAWYSLDWVRFLPVALLLIFPLPLFFGRKTQYRALDESWAKRTGKAISYPWHWLDLVRAFVCTRLLLQLLEIHPPEHLAPKPAFLVFGALLVVAVTTQTVGCKSPNAFHAPFGFVTGVLLSVLPPIGSGLTLLSALTVALAFRAAPAFFGAAAILAGLFGTFFFPVWLLLAPLVVLSGIPLILPILFQRDFVLAHRPLRETHHDHGPLR